MQAQTVWTDNLPPGLEQDGFAMLWAELVEKTAKDLASNDEARRVAAIAWIEDTDKMIPFCQICALFGYDYDRAKKAIIAHTKH